MKGLSYPERLTVLKMYSLQRRRERYIIIYVWKSLARLVPNLFPPICIKAMDRREWTCVTAHIDVRQFGTSGYNSFRWFTNCLFNLCFYVMSVYVLFIVSRKNWIPIYLQCMIFRVSQNSTTAWTMENV